MNSVGQYLRKDGVKSASATAAIVVALIVATGTTAAMQVKLSGVPSGTQDADGKTTFKVKMVLNEDDQYLPITGLEVDVGDKTAPIDISAESSSANFLTVKNVSTQGGEAANLGYGYGYDADRNTTFGYGEGFGYGYGYGYDYGYETDGTRSIIVEVTVDNSKLSSGDHDVSVWAEVSGGGNRETYTSDTKTLTIASEGDSGGNGGSGGSGGSGGGVAPVDDNQTEGQPEDPAEGTPGEDVSDNQTQEGPGRVVEATPSENGTARAVIPNVGANEKVQVTIPEQAAADGAAAVEAVSFTSSTDASDVSVQVEEIGSSFEKIKNKVENKRPEGKVYSYQSIDVSGLEDGSISQASISFKVNKSFIEENEATVEDVRLNRFHNGEWESYDANKTGETESHYKFEAETPGFSTYAITLAQEEEKVDEGGLPLVPILVVLVLAVVVGAAYMYRDEVEEFMAGSESGESEDEDYSYEE